MPYGFVIDQTRCIGCHACTVACKSENDVPVGDFRTWVKYTEIGTFPQVRRHFAVLRCNHCTSAPCVTICPVNALEKRPDGIVDLDRDVCIGCKACMQACPYDALYLNESTGSAEKCHYCAHRVDQGLEPACVVVCPEEAIISGDFSDPDSKIARLRARSDAVVRRPEQGTGPNVHYIGIDSVSLDPGSAREPEAYLWSERRIPAPDYPADIDLVPDATTVYDVNHPVRWGSKVAAYLVTKGISAGCVLLAPLAGLWAADWRAAYLPEILGLAFLGATLVLLVADLKRPQKFLSILLRPNTRSWLVLGAYVLMAFGLIATLALGARLLAAGLLGADVAPAFDLVADLARLLGVPLALGAAGYTAFLFRQCEGRDLWQDTAWLLPHLCCQALLLGAATLVVAIPHESFAWLLTIGGIAHLLFALRETTATHETTNARLAARLLPRVPLRPGSRHSAFTVGLWATTLAALLAPALYHAGILGHGTAAVLCLLTYAGTFLYEQAYVRAGQLPPLS